MSIYWVNFVCRQLVRDPEFRRQMKEVPDSALSTYQLTSTERSALASGDVGTLYGLGANGFLLGYLCRYEIAGLTLDIYGQRMRAVAQDGLQPGSPTPSHAPSELFPNP